MAPSYDFYMEVNSTNPELGSSFDNIIRKSVVIDVETNLSINGRAVDAEIHYNISEFRNITNATKEAEIGPQVVNIYEISNGGPSTINEAEVFVLIPHLTIAGEHLMYILDKPETGGNVQCEPINYINPLNLKLDEALSKKSYLYSQGAISGSKTVIHGSGVSIEKAVLSTASSSSSGSKSSSGGQRFFTEEEKRKFDADEEQESTGDASLIHRNRASQAAQSTANRAHSSSFEAQSGAAGSRNFGQEQSYSSSSNSSRRGSGPVVTYSASQSRSGIRGEDGRMIYTESSTQSYGTSDNVRSQSYFQQQNQGGHSNSETSGRYQAGQGNTYRAGGGRLKIDDFPTEESVNQDISGLQSRSQSEGATSISGRRRMKSQQDGEPPRPDLITGVSAMEKVAQGGQGFRTSSLDLGTLGRDNVDDELRHRGGSSHVATDGGYQSSRVHSHNTGGSSSGHQAGGSGHHASSSSYSTHGGAGGHQQHSHHSSSSSANQGVSTGGRGYTQSSSSYGHDGGTGTQQDYEDDYTDDVNDDYYEGTDDVDPTPHSRTTQPNDKQRFKLYGRTKRQSIDFNDLALEEALHCNSTQCAIIRCVTGPLEKDSIAWIAIRTRLVAATLNKVRQQVQLVKQQKVTKFF